MHEKTEQAIMNSRIRAWFMAHYEYPVFQKFLSRQQVDLTHRVLLDAGCGCGYSTALIERLFQPSKLYAFDLAPEQIARFKPPEPHVHVFVGDVTALDLPDQACDAVFMFGVLHHLADWQAGLDEIYRVLKPGGVYLGGEPQSLAGFEWPPFAAGLKATGFELVDFQKIYVGFFINFMCHKRN